MKEYGVHGSWAKEYLFPKVARFWSFNSFSLFQLWNDEFLVPDSNNLGYYDLKEETCRPIVVEGYWMLIFCGQCNDGNLSCNILELRKLEVKLKQFAKLELFKGHELAEKGIGLQRNVFALEQLDMYLLEPIVLLGSNEFSWRWIENSLPRSTYGNGKHVNNHLHWTSRGHGESFTIVAFDMAAEEIHEIGLPPLLGLDNVVLGRDICYFLGVINERLCLFCDRKLDHSYYEIWVMKEYGVHGSWAKEYLFNTKVASFWSFDSFSLFKLWNDEFLVPDTPGSSSLGYYALKEETCRPIVVEGHWMLIFCGQCNDGNLSCNILELRKLEVKLKQFAKLELFKGHELAEKGIGLQRNVFALEYPSKLDPNAQNKMENGLDSADGVDHVPYREDLADIPLPL
ncbi:hypothetical protein IFM89_012327 [Coptis chinensis]|uniref:F-box associated domain-containing protein n=1 Tax=Coptis chinensis TaxID=261450 RepID=A0A835I2V1_9MAGN|nr:hypothetical protein IFM89_012327 [Coptis chinensis]